MSDMRMVMVLLFWMLVVRLLELYHRDYYHRDQVQMLVVMELLFVWNMLVNKVVGVDLVFANNVYVKGRNLVVGIRSVRTV